MARTDICLISLALATQTDELRRGLHELGYEVNAVEGAGQTPEDRLLKTSTVMLFLGSEPRCDKNLRSLLDQLAGIPTIAVVHRNHTPDDFALLDQVHDFMFWPCALDELALRLNRLTTASGAANPTRVSAQALVDEFTLLNLIGQSPVFIAAILLIKKIARFDAPVLIDGETGTGKELAARAIHYLGSRRDYPFIPVNCGAIPDNLFENELFGHERGAFTDAKEAQAGLVAQADGGTLFLDEVDVLSSKGQVALLRFLQDQQYQPLGAKTRRQANIRVVAASNTALEEQVSAGKFRQDLLYRLKVLSLQLPPLRERHGDVRLLAAHFIGRHCARYHCDPKSIHPTTLNWLERYDWPGNVRELESFVLRGLLLSEGSVLHIKPPSFATERRLGAVDRRRAQFDAANFQEAKRQTLAEFEKAFIYRALSETNGNVTLAAVRVGKERRAFGKLIKKYNIDPLTCRVDS